MRMGKAFTLVETLAVLGIVATLMASAFEVAGVAQRKAAVSRTRAQIATMALALENYKLDHGAYPTGNGDSLSSTNLYAALAGSTKRYLSFRGYLLSGNPTNVMDRFGSAYYYLSPGIKNPPGFDLWSAGPDRTTNTADDVNNWTR